MAEITYTINQSTPEGVQGTEVFKQSDKDLLQSFTVNSTFDSSKHLVELHILTLSDELIESDYNYSSYSILQGGQVGTAGASVLSIDPIRDVKTYDYNTGGVKLLYHFYNDIFTKDKSTTEFFIQEISPDRTELRLSNLTIPSGQIISSTTEVKNALDSQSFFKELRLNFKNNDLFIVTNIDITYQGDNPLVTVKLYEPLPGTYGIKDRLSVVEFVNDSIVYEVDSTVSIDQVKPITLQAPNFNLDLIDENVIPSQYFNYDELFSYQVGNSTNEIFSLFSEKGAEISIDHTDFQNFIHFSSAEERLLNFKYKLDLIDTYNNNLASIQNSVTSTGTQGSVEQFNGLIKGIVNNFDHYERYLYYESGSDAWPKSTTTKPYINKESTDPEAINWFTAKRSEAIYFDKQNPHQLLNTVPTYLRDDPNNEKYSIFIHMIAQHFDTLWLYSKSVTDKYDADNRLDKGISKDLVGEALKNFGIKIYTSNKSTEELFSSLIGQPYDQGTEQLDYYITGSLIGTGTPIAPSSFNNYQKEIQKRIYHNLSYLLKTKGTERGLRALINCFGIPSDILSIKTYGGRNTNERPFYGDYQHYTSSLDKIRLDHTGSIVEGNTLSSYTSIIKRDNKYTDDLHVIEVGFSPTDNVDKYIISKSLADPNLSTFNIDQYIGDPSNLTLPNYDGLYQAAEDILGDLTQYNVKDFVRLIKFFDNVIFKMVKDFIPARSVADIGIIIKPHLLQRNKAKSPILSGSRPEYTGSIDTAFIEGGNGGVFKSATQGVVEEELNTSYNQIIQTPSGPGVDTRHTHQEASFDGELKNSLIRVSNGELNSRNLFKTPTFFTNNFDINRWLDAEGLCILNPYTTYIDTNGGIFYSSSNNTMYLDSGSWNSSDIFTGLSQISMEYEITSSNIPTGSYIFPFNTDSYLNYTTHSLTASNTGVQGGCTSSITVQVAVCDIDQTALFRSSVKDTEPYNIATWFITGSQNPSSNISLNIVNNINSNTVYDGLLEGATGVVFNGGQDDTYTLTVQDTEIPLTCTYTYPIAAGLCSVVTSSLYVSFRNLQGIGRWSTDLFLGTGYLNVFGTPTENNYGLARFFTGVNPDNETYRVRVYDPFTLGTVVERDIIPPQQGIELFTTETYPFLPNAFGNYPLYELYWYYGPTNIPGSPITDPAIGGNVALVKVRYTQQFLDNNPQVAPTSNGIYAETFYIDITAVESTQCTPVVSLRPSTINTSTDSDSFTDIDADTCCFVANTLITLSDYTKVRIDEIKVGDKVLSYNEITQQQSTSTVLSVESPTKNDIVTFTLSGGIEVQATTEHPMWVVGKGWSSYSPELTYRDHKMVVSKLQQGDVLLLQDGQHVELQLMELGTDTPYQTVYNLCLDGDNTYYANTILVHNKLYIP